MTSGKIKVERKNKIALVTMDSASAREMRLMSPCS